MKLVALVFGVWLAVSLLFGLFAGRVLRGHEENELDLPDGEPPRGRIIQFHNYRAG